MASSTRHQPSRLAESWCHWPPDATADQPAVTASHRAITETSSAARRAAIRPAQQGTPTPTRRCSAPRTRRRGAGRGGACAAGGLAPGVVGGASLLPGHVVLRGIARNAGRCKARVVSSAGWCGWSGSHRWGLAPVANPCAAERADATGGGGTRGRGMRLVPQQNGQAVTSGRRRWGRRAAQPGETTPHRVPAARCFVIAPVGKPTARSRRAAHCRMGARRGQPSLAGERLASGSTRPLRARHRAGGTVGGFRVQSVGCPPGTGLAGSSGIVPHGGPS